MGARVVVGMSGGVDSSVAAYLLKEQGYDVIGVTMQIWQDESREEIQDRGGCCGLSAVEDARRVADLIGIPYYVLNFKAEFQHAVIDYFVEEYLRGRTPNPCIACNRYVKWEALLRRSLALGAEYIATGHYARIGSLPNGRYAVRSSAAPRKDQSYALYSLTQEQLRHTLMPIGEYDKESVRAIADRVGLPVAAKRDSQEICFVPDRDYASFISREKNGNVPGEGNFVSETGEVLGRHRGITHYTVGQRKGLRLALGQPMYVTKICPETNEVVLGREEAVYSESLTCHEIRYMGAADFESPCRVRAKIRYSHAGQMCRIEKTGEDRLKCIFEHPVRAVTPGQAVVFYDASGYVLGGGTID